MLTSPTSTTPDNDKKSSKLSADNGRKPMLVKPRVPKTPKSRPGSHAEAFEKSSGDLQKEGKSIQSSLVVNACSFNIVSVLSTLRLATNFI